MNEKLNNGQRHRGGVPVEATRRWAAAVAPQGEKGKVKEANHL